MHTLNTIGLICPEPVMLLHKSIRTLASGECLTVIATDPATTRDIPNFCQHLGHALVSHSTSETCELPSETDETDFDIFYHYVIKKA